MDYVSITNKDIRLPKESNHRKRSTPKLSFTKKMAAILPWVNEEKERLSGWARVVKSRGGPEGRYKQGPKAIKY